MASDDLRAFVMEVAGALAPDELERLDFLLAAHDAVTRRKALEDGWDECARQIDGAQSHSWARDRAFAANPYRALAVGGVRAEGDGKEGGE